MRTTLIALATAVTLATTLSASISSFAADGSSEPQFTKQQIFIGTKLEIEQLLKTADKDGDHKVSRAEFLQNAHETYVKYDKEKKGGLTFDEYKEAAFAELDQQKKMDPTVVDTLEQVKKLLVAHKDAIMLSIDTDNDGVLSFAELEKDQDNSFNHLDLNGDGYLDETDIEALKKALGL